MEIMARPDAPLPATPVRVPRGLTLRVMAVAAVIAALILAHWIYLYGNGISRLSLPKGTWILIAELYIFLLACAAVLIGGLMLALDFGLARLGLYTERRLHTVGALGFAGLSAFQFFKAGDERYTSPYTLFTIGTVPVTNRDMLFLNLGAWLLLVVYLSSSALRLGESRKSRQHED